MQNAVYSIRPYRWQNMWVFDDERVGLVKEPFVMGIPEIINKAVAHLPSPQQGFTVLFNNTGLPSADVVLKKVETESNGTWYEQEGIGLKRMVMSRAV
jgi:hypothetical protein